MECVERDDLQKDLWVILYSNHYKSSLSPGMTLSCTEISREKMKYFLFSNVEYWSVTDFRRFKMLQYVFKSNLERKLHDVTAGFVFIT
jgi:hypothetical protein